jgi:hypothetical protein
MPDVEKETFNVSSAHPDKVVVNGVDLVNREQLSKSQNRELQRFIDNNSHLLGFYDRPKDERDSVATNDGGYFGGKYDASLNRSSKNYDYDSDKRGTQSLNRIGSPYSDYGSKGRKGVSFADDGKGGKKRASSHSPSHNDRSSGYGSTYDPYGSGAGLNDRRGTGNYGNYGNSPASTIDRRPASARGANSGSGGRGNRQLDQSLRSRTESPSSQFKWKPYSSYNPDDERTTVAPPFPSWLKDRSLTPAYSSLQRHPDNYNRYGTEKYWSQANRSSREKDEEIKFYGFGDRVGSGIELSRKRWTGGELITDPTYLQKSLKPRTMFYSPIGDGTVAADGIELKPGPPDLTPRVHVTHERIIERSAGKAGRRVYEKTWDTGGRGPNDDDGRGAGWPNDDDGRGKGWPNDDDGRGKGWPNDDGNRNGLGDPYGTLGSGDGYPRSTPLSFDSDRVPREGWTKTFIVNPRELINQYGTETLTTIFDLEDHTPKTLTTIKETVSAIEAD